MTTTPATTPHDHDDPEVGTPREPLPAPDGLADTGRALWDSVTSTYDLRTDELALLAEMARLLDDLAMMREVLAADGPMVAGSKGQRRPHPILAEMRGSRLLLVRFASQIGLPDLDGDEAGATPASRRAARAANARWQREMVL